MKITKNGEARKSTTEISFCYICGQPLPILDLSGGVFSKKSVEVNEDHVVASAIFSPQDRDFPLKLKVHKSCHDRQGIADQKMAELMRLLWDPSDKQVLEQLDLNWDVDQNGRGTASSWSDDVPTMVFRWLMGFHAALYGEWLPDSTKRSTLLPFHEYRAGQIVDPHPHFYQFANVIERNRAARNIDEISIYNGKCKYQCVWGSPIPNEYNCYFTLDINGWSVFSGQMGGVWRTCIGAYTLNRLPLDASIATGLIFDVGNVSLDLFPDERKVHIGDQVLKKEVYFRGRNILES